MLTAEGDHVFHARTSLPTRADPAAAATDVAAKLLGPAVRNGIRRVVFLFFSADERVVRRVWAALRHGCERSRLRIVDAVRVDDRRYYPLFGDKVLREVGIDYDVAGASVRRPGRAAGDRRREGSGRLWSRASRPIAARRSRSRRRSHTAV